MKKTLSVLLCLILVFGTFAVGGISVSSLNVPTKVTSATKQPEIANWEGWRSAAATFTFDDGATEVDSHKEAAKALDKYGYKGTFYIVTNWISDWTPYKTMANNGHEIGSHSVTHSSYESEYGPSRRIIETNIGKPCLTIAYANGNRDGQPENYYIAGRMCGSGIMGVNGPTDWTAIDSNITGSEGPIITKEDFISGMQSAIDNNGWIVFLTHGFKGVAGRASFSPTDPDAFKDALDWANDNDDDIWVTSLVNATMYVKERNASTLNLSASDDTTATYTLTHSLPKTVCELNYPLSVRVPLPTGWSGASVTQKDDAVDSVIKDGMVYFSAVPNGGNIVLTKATGPAPVYSVGNISTSNYAKYNQIVTASVKLDNLPEGATVKIDGNAVDVKDGMVSKNFGRLTTDKSFVLSVYDGDNELDSKTLTISVKQGFFDKFIAFFAKLFKGDNYATTVTFK